MTLPQQTYKNFKIFSECPNTTLTSPKPPSPHSNSTPITMSPLEHQSRKWPRLNSTNHTPNKPSKNNPTRKTKSSTPHLVHNEKSSSTTNTTKNISSRFTETKILESTSSTRRLWLIRGMTMTRRLQALRWEGECTKPCKTWKTSLGIAPAASQVDIMTENT